MPVDNNTLCQPNYHESAFAKFNANSKLKEEAIDGDILNGGLQKQGNANPQLPNETAATQLSYNATDCSDRTTNSYENAETESTDEEIVDDYVDIQNYVFFLNETAATQPSYSATDCSDRIAKSYEDEVTESSDEEIADDYVDIQNYAFFPNKTAATQLSYSATDCSDTTTNSYEDEVTESTDEEIADDYVDILNNVFTENTSECCQVKCTRLDSLDNEVTVANSSTKSFAENSTSEVAMEGNGFKNHEQSCTSFVHETTPWSSDEGTRAPSFSNATIESTQAPPPVTSRNNSDASQKPVLKRRSSAHVWINIPCDTDGIPSIINDTDTQQATTNSDEVILQKNPSYSMVSDKHTTASHDETVKLRRKPRAHFYETIPFKRRPVSSIDGGTSKAVKGHVYEVIPYRKSRCVSASISTSGSADRQVKIPSNTQNLKHRSVHFIN